MRKHITGLSGCKVTHDAFDMKLAQATCFVAAGLVPAVSVWKLTRLDLTEPQLYCGLLLSLTTPLLFIIIGLLLPMSAAARNARVSP